MGRTREGTSWAAKAEKGSFSEAAKRPTGPPGYLAKKKAPDWFRDVGSGNTGLHWVNPCRRSSSYMGIAAGPSSRRPWKTRQLASILAGFCNRRALHTTHSLSEACLPCPFLPLCLQAGSSDLVPAAHREQWQ